MEGFLFDTWREGEAPPASQPGGFRLFPHQQDCVDRIRRHLAEHQRCNIAAATGLGKTEVGIALAEQDWGGSVMWLAPRQKLIRQTVDRFNRRGVPCDVEMGTDKADIERIVVASYQTLIRRGAGGRRRLDKFLGTTGLVIIDEYHAYYSQTCLQLINELVESGAKVLAMTASPPPPKQNKKTGEWAFVRDNFGETVYTYTIADAQQDGWLCEGEYSICVLEDADTSDLKSSFGDIDQQAAAEILKKRTNVAAVRQMIEQHWGGRPSIVFASDIDHADLLRLELEANGLAAAIVHTDENRMTADEREYNLHMFERGDVDIIINVGILIMGYDCPKIENVFIASFTKSTMRYLQQVGRASRTVLGGELHKYSTAEERRAAIARSPKPRYYVYDITDSSRACDIKNALDVLYPELHPDLTKRVKRRMVGQPKSREQIDAIIAEERAALAAMEKAKREHQLQKSMAWHVDATVRSYQRDPNAPTERYGRGSVDYWWMPYGKFKGKGFRYIHEQAPWYLPFMLRKQRLVEDGNLRRNVAAFLRRKNKAS